MEDLNQPFFVDIHTHSPCNSVGDIQIINLFPEQVIEKLPALSLEDHSISRTGNGYSVGWHPWYLKEELFDQMLQIVDAGCRRPEVWAVGECGLDHKSIVPFGLQQKVFRAHAMIAGEVNKPLLIHCVRSSNEVIKLKKELKPQVPWIIHGFNSNLITGRELLRHGLILSLGIDLLKDYTNATHFLPEIPIRQLVFESGDASISVEKIYQKAADRLSIDLSDLKEKIQANFIRMFPLPFVSQTS